MPKKKATTIKRTELSPLEGRTFEYVRNSNWGSFNWMRIVDGNPMPAAVADNQMLKRLLPKAKPGDVVTVKNGKLKSAIPATRP